MGPNVFLDANAFLFFCYVNFYPLFRIFPSVVYILFHSLPLAVPPADTYDPKRTTVLSCRGLRGPGWSRGHQPGLFLRSDTPPHLPRVRLRGAVGYLRPHCRGGGVLGSWAPPPLGGLFSQVGFPSPAPPLISRRFHQKEPPAPTRPCGAAGASAPPASSSVCVSSDGISPPQVRIFSFSL